MPPAFAQEEREQRRFLDTAGMTVAAQRRSAMEVGLCGAAIGLANTLGTVAVLGLGTREVLAGRLTLGQLTVFLAYTATLQGQCKAMATTYADLKGLGASVRRVKELVPGGEASPVGSDIFPDKAPELAFEGVTFGYAPGRPVVRAVSFRVPAGGTVGIVGSTGSGKSTLAALALRLFEPWEGRVLVHGGDARAFDIHSLRSGIAIAMQDAALFPTSVASNIAIGRPGASQTEIQRAAGDAMAHDFIMALPEGYGEVLGERGGTLSGGERQRLSIARALLRDAPVLILDEATSALDTETEAALFERLSARAKQRTTIIIAHRLSTVRSADWIVVVEAGRVAEQGRHEDLLAAGGVYASMWREHKAARGAPAVGREVRA